jgi:hypothetical protein
MHATSNQFTVTLRTLRQVRSVYFNASIAAANALHTMKATLYAYAVQSLVCHRCDHLPHSTTQLQQWQSIDEPVSLTPLTMLLLFCWLFYLFGGYLLDGYRV